MLSVLCAISFMGASIEFTLPVRHVRPSRIVEQMLGGNGRRSLLSDGAQVGFDDSKSVVIVRGSAEDLRVARDFVRVTDVPIATIKLKIHIDSPADKFAYDLQTEMRSGQRWKMSEDVTGTSLGLIPRINSDGTCTLVCDVESPGGSISTAFRLRPGKVERLKLGDKVYSKVVVNDQGRDVSYGSVPLPTISFSFDSNLPKPYRAQPRR